MANPFSPTTTGGVSGEFIYGDLTDKQSAQTRAIALSRAAKYEAEDQQRVDNYVVALRALDQNALTKLQTINGKKQQIVTIIDNVYNNRGANLLDSDPGSIGDTTGTKVVYVAGLSTFTYDCVGDDPPICEVGVRGEIFPDILTAWNYPNVESLNVSSDFYRQGEGYVNITGANLGIGVTAYEYGDAAGSTGFIGLVTTANSSLGYYYFFPNLSSVDAGSATSITNIVTEIETLRTEIDSFLSDIETGTNNLRVLKSNAQIDLWFEKKGQQSSVLPSYQDGIETIEDSTNANIIQNYNS